MHRGRGDHALYPKTKSPIVRGLASVAHNPQPSFFLFFVRKSRCKKAFASGDKTLSVLPPDELRFRSH